MSPRIFLLAALCAAVIAMPAWASRHPAPSAGGLKQKYDELRPRLEKNAFGRPLAIDSAHAGDELRGEAYAIVAQPFARVREALSRPEHWCEVLTLPFNVQKCDTRGDSLQLFIGRKPESPIGDATRLDLRFAVAERSDEQLHVHLSAPKGPAGTRDYRIRFVAVPLAAERTLVQFSYGYSTSFMARVALETYLSTSGAEKVGFSAEGEDENGKPRLVGGVRGVVERNTMRYYLAVEAFLNAYHRPEGERRKATLENWFSAVERYPRQLKEMSREKYLSLKLAPAA